MRKFLLLIFGLLVSAVLNAQEPVNVTITDLNNSALTSAAQQNISRLLTEVNRCYVTNTVPDFQNLPLSGDVKKSLKMLWSGSPFMCKQNVIKEFGIHIYHTNDYEIRNIPLFFRDMDNQEQKVAIAFDASGTITSFHITVDQNTYKRIFKRQDDVVDMRRRQIILDYVERFRTAYNTKDLNFMNQIFGDDALIITGRVIQTKESSYKVEYRRKDKEQYLADLKRVFNANKSIHVEFSDVKINIHPSKHDFYYVRLIQNYRSDLYRDEGYLFLLWDFSEGDDKMPIIHVRVWQPNKDKQGNPLPPDQLFGIDDLDIN